MKVNERMIGPTPLNKRESFGINNFNKMNKLANDYME